MKSNKEVAENIDGLTKSIRSRLIDAINKGETAYITLSKNGPILYPRINLSGNLPNEEVPETALDPYKTLTTVYSYKPEHEIINYNNDYKILESLFKILGIDTTIIEQMDKTNNIDILSSLLLDGKHALTIAKQFDKDGHFAFVSSVINAEIPRNADGRILAVASSDNMSSAIIGATHNVSLNRLQAQINAVKINEGIRLANDFPPTIQP